MSYFAAILFCLVMSGLGVVIANKSATMLQSILIPPRYFIEIMRSVYLKGATLSELWVQFAVLAVFAAGFLLVASLIYKKRE